MSSQEEYLQKLIFEVYGADEGIRKLEEINQAEEKRKRSIKGLVREAKSAAKAEVRAAKESAREQEKAAQQAADARKKLAEETKQTAMVAGAALAMLAKAALQASADMEEVAGQLARTVRKAGSSQEDLAASLAVVDAESRKYGRSALEQRQLLDGLIDASGSLTQATYDLALANDIAATGDLSAAAAAEMLTKARKGEVEELKRLDGITKDHAAELGKITDETERGARAIAILTKEYSGASKELKGTNDALNNITEAGKDLLVVIGDTSIGLINGFATLVGVIEPGEDLLDRFSRGLRNFSGEASEAAAILKDFNEYRAAGGDGVFSDGFAEYLSQKDSQRAIGAAAANKAPAAKPLTPGRRRGNAQPTLPEGFEETAAAAEKEREKEAEDRRKRAIERAKEEEEEAQRRWEAQNDRHDETRKRLEDEAKAVEKAEKDKAKAVEDRAKEVMRWEEEQRDFRMKMAEDQAAIRESEIKAQKKLAEAHATATQHKIDAAQAGASALGEVAKSFAKDQGTAAKIEAGLGFLRAGVAFALAATPPPLGGPQYLPGAIAQTAAATALAAQAAQLGAGGGAGKGGGAIVKGAGGGKGGGSAPPADPGFNSASPRGDAQLLNQRSSRGEQASAVTYNINVVGTPTPDEARRLFDAMESERRNR